MIRFFSFICLLGGTLNAAAIPHEGSFQFASGEGQQKIILQLSSKVTVPADLPLVLGDLASIEDPNSLPDGVLNAPLDLQGKTGETKTLTHSLVHSLVRAGLRKSGIQEGVTLFVPGEMTLEFQQGAFLKHRFANAISLQLKKKCADCRFTLQSAKTSQNILQAKNLNFDFSRVKLNSSFLIPVRTAREQSTDTPIAGYITGSVKMERSVLLPAKSLQAGDVIQKEDLVKDWVEFNQEIPTAWSLQELIGRQLQRSKGTNQAFLKADFRKQDLVTKGQTVRVVFESDVFEISQNMIAEESAGFGENVRLKSLDGKKTFVGKVVENQTARVE